MIWKQANDGFNQNPLCMAHWAMGMVKSFADWTLPCNKVVTVVCTNASVPSGTIYICPRWGRFQLWKIKLEGMQWLPELKLFQIEQEKSREENFDEFLEDLFMWLPFRCCEIEKKLCLRMQCQNMKSVLDRFAEWLEASVVNSFKKRFSVMCKKW